MENHQIVNESAKANLREEVSRNVPDVGPSEFLLALRTVGANASKIAEEIHRRRDAIIGPANRLGNSTLLPDSERRRIRSEAESAARRELLDGSATVAELDELQHRAAVAAEKARAKQAEFDRRWTEFQSLPAKHEAVGARLQNVLNEKASLDSETLQAQFKDIYRHVVLGTGVVSGDALAQFASIFETRELRITVLDELEVELRAQLEQLKHRNGELARKLDASKYGVIL
jgi:hypothetical protein